MSSGLLDRLLDPEYHFSWRNALRIIPITVAFHAIGLIVLGITEPLVRAEGLHLRDVGYLLFAVGFSVLPYWAVFVLAGFSDVNKPARSWRVWSAWLLITYPLADLYLMEFFGDLDADAGLVPLVLTFLSPVFTLVGAIAGYLLWLLYRWLRTGFVAAVEESKMSSDLLDRLVNRGLSWRYALRLVLITAAFQLSA